MTGSDRGSDVDHAGAADRHAHDELDRSLAHGVAWTAGSKWITQLVSWAVTLLVARILTPEDYGLMGMALVYLGFVRLVNNFGVGAAIIQRPELPERKVGLLGGFSVLVGVGFFAVSVVLAQPIAGFFREPAVRWIVTLLSFNLIVSSFRVVSRSLLTRELQFRTLARIEMIQGISTPAVTLAFALAGFAYWSLVIGALFSELVATTMTVLARPFRPAFSRSIKEVAPELGFGTRVVASNIGWYVYSNADYAVVGRMLGTAPLGAYNIGFTLASQPIVKISAIISRVTPSIFARVQHDPAGLARYLGSVTRSISLLTFPAGIGLALVADSFVTLVLGAKWEAAIAPLRLLALAMCFRSVTGLLSQVLIATDNTGKEVRFTAAAMVILPFLFVAGIPWGTTGVAAAWIVGHPAVAIPLLVRPALRVAGMPWHGYFMGLWPAASSCAVMAAAVIAARAALPATATPLLSLAVGTGTGILTYSGFLWLFHRDAITSILGFARKQFGHRPVVSND